MREINELIWHCTATPEGREVSVSEIDKWHRQLGWRGIGYHKVVHLDGSVSDGRVVSEVGAHVKGHNTGTIGYAYVGGVAVDGKTPADTRTAAQKVAMRALTADAIAQYSLTRVSGHRQYAAKACPSFDAAGEYAPLLEGSLSPPSADTRMTLSKPAPRKPPSGNRIPPWLDWGVPLLVAAALGAAFLYLTLR